MCIRDRFGAVWWLGQANLLALGRRLIGAALPLIAVVGTLLTEYEMEATDGRVRLPEGVAMGVVLALTTVALAVRLRQRGRPLIALEQ